MFFEPNGGSLVGFYGRDGLAANVGASPEGSGFSGLVLTVALLLVARTWPRTTSTHPIPPHHPGTPLSSSFCVEVLTKLSSWKASRPSNRLALRVFCWTRAGVPEHGQDGQG